MCGGVGNNKTAGRERPARAPHRAPPLSSWLEGAANIQTYFELCKQNSKKSKKKARLAARAPRSEPSLAKNLRSERYSSALTSLR